MKKLSIFTILILLIAAFAWAADTTYGPKFYRTDGGDKAVVADGGEMKVESGGTLTLDTGSTLNAYGGSVISGLTAAYVVTSHAITTNEDWVMSATEEKATYLIVSGGTGGDVTVNVKGTATSGQRFVVRNASNNSVLVLKSGATGVTIASGKTAAVFGYAATDYYRETADATH